MSRERTCKRCGAIWVQKLASGRKPIQCPRCHSLHWDEAPDGRYADDDRITRNSPRKRPAKVSA